MATPSPLPNINNIIRVARKITDDMKMNSFAAGFFGGNYTVKISHVMCHVHNLLYFLNGVLSSADVTIKSQHLDSSAILLLVLYTFMCVKGKGKGKGKGSPYNRLRRPRGGNRGVAILFLYPHS